MYHFFKDDLFLPIVRRFGTALAGMLVGALSVTNPEQISQIETIAIGGSLLTYDLLVSRFDRKRLK